MHLAVNADVLSVILRKISASPQTLVKYGLLRNSMYLNVQVICKSPLPRFLSPLAARLISFWYECKCVEGEGKLIRRAWAGQTLYIP